MTTVFIIRTVVENETINIKKLTNATRSDRSTTKIT